MRVEHGEGRIETLCIQVVEQQPHPHPPLGRLPERLEQEVANLVAMPDVVLGVERLFGGIGEQDARGERIARIGQRMDARLAGIRGDAGAIARPSRVPAVSVRAVVSTRSFGGGSVAQPVATTTNAPTTYDRSSFI